MKRAIKIDLTNGMVTLDDGSQKTLDNYILELEDRLIKIYSILESYNDVEPWSFYKVSGDKLFKVMDIVEGK